MDTITKAGFAKKLGVSPQYDDKIEYRLTMVNVPGKKKKQINLMGAHTLEFLKEREETIEIDPPPIQEPPQKKPAKKIKAKHKPKPKKPATPPPPQIPHLGIQITSFFLGIKTDGNLLGLHPHLITKLAGNLQTQYLGVGIFSYCMFVKFCFDLHPAMM